jgi:hypothetical protein
MLVSDLVRAVAANFSDGDAVPMAILPIGVPYFIVRLTAVCVERKELGILREFILRAIQNGWPDVDGVASFLGVGTTEVQEEIDELVKEFFVSSHGTPPILSLMEKGLKAICETGLTQASVREVGCCVNGVTRQVEISPGDLFPRRRLQEGVLVLPAIPARPPQIDELDVVDIKGSLIQARTPLPRIIEVARLGRVIRTNSLFMPGFLMLRRGVHAVPLVCVNGAEETALARQLGGHPALEAAKSVVSRHELQVRKTFYQHRSQMRSAEFSSGETVRAAVTSLVQYCDAASGSLHECESRFLAASNALIEDPHWLGVPEAQVLFIRAVLAAKLRIVVVAPPVATFIFEVSALEALNDACKRGVTVEIYAGANDQRFFGERRIFGPKTHGINVMPIGADRSWCGFSCDDKFCVIGAAKAASTSMGRFDVFFGGVIPSDRTAVELLLSLGPAYVVPVLVKPKKRVLPST